MRPRKTILCVDGDEHRLSLRVMLLEVVGGYRVLRATSSELGLRQLAHWRATGGVRVDLLIAELPALAGDEMCRKAKALDPEIRTMLLTTALDQDGYQMYADRALGRVSSANPRQLLDAVQILTRRKRGPKKRVARVEVAAGAVEQVRA